MLSARKKIRAGRQFAILNKMFREGLTEEMTHEQRDLRERGQGAMERPGKRAFQAEGTACAKALRQDRACCVERIARRTL